MRRPLVAGNWKMNGSSALALSLAEGAVACATGIGGGVDIVLCPPAPYLAQVKALTADRGVEVGAQDCSEHDEGAFTGEVSAGMLRDVGATYVIVGHSERRRMFGDTDERVALKLARAGARGLTPILCVGETLEQRRDDATEAVIAGQLEAVAALQEAGRFLPRAVIAYEPVWAIGTGESATPAQAQAVHAFIRAWLERLGREVATAMRIVYGGSVKPANAEELFAMPDIDGGLIGGASLEAESFAAICRAAA